MPIFEMFSLLEWSGKSSLSKLYVQLSVLVPKKRKNVNGHQWEKFKGTDDCPEHAMSDSTDGKMVHHID